MKIYIPNVGREARATPHFIVGIARAAALVLALSLLPAGPARASNPEAAANPRAFVEGLGGEVVGILKSKDVPLAERQQRFRTLFTEAFDAPVIGRFVLGPYWNGASEEQRRKYLKIFSDYVAAIYAVQFAHYQGETFKTIGMSPLGAGDEAIRTEIDRPGGQPLPVVFRVRGTPGHFKIVDVSVEGISLIITKRDEFASVLKDEGLDGVMQRMKAVIERTKAA